MEEQSQQTNQQPSGQKPQGSNNTKTSGIAIAVLLVLIAAYAFSQKKDPEPVAEPAIDDGAVESDDDGADMMEQEQTDGIVETNVNSEPGTTNTNAPATESGSVSASEVFAYKDGTYTAVGDYVSPGGAEQVGLTLTLKDGIVTDSVLQVMATRPISLKMQDLVRDEHKAFVVGKPLDEVKLDKVSSSSLTPVGFNDAIEKIKKQATS